MSVSYSPDSEPDFIWLQNVAHYCRTAEPSYFQNFGMISDQKI